MKEKLENKKEPEKKTINFSSEFLTNQELTPILQSLQDQLSEIKKRMIVITTINRRCE